MEKLHPIVVISLFTEKIYKMLICIRSRMNKKGFLVIKYMFDFLVKRITKIEEKQERSFWNDYFNTYW